MNTHLIEFQHHGDERGMLVALEFEKECPFSIKRVYYVYGTGHNVRRGYHSHKTLQQILVCVSGSCQIRVDDGHRTDNFILNRPDQGLYIGTNIWREMYDFSCDAVLLVLASEVYDETDYIRDYQVFADMVHA